jgi:hypothetical protein
MGIWDNLFGKSKAKKTENSPFLPKQDDPLDIGFAINFTSKGGKFLFNESKSNLAKNFKDICIENNCEPKHVISLDDRLSNEFGTGSVPKKICKFKSL